MKFDPVKRDFALTAEESADLFAQAFEWDTKQDWSVMGYFASPLRVLGYPLFRHVFGPRS